MKKSLFILIFWIFILGINLNAFAIIDHSNDWQSLVNRKDELKIMAQDIARKHTEYKELMYTFIRDLNQITGDDLVKLQNNFTQDQQRQVIEKETQAINNLITGLHNAPSLTEKNPRISRLFLDLFDPMLAFFEEQIALIKIMLDTWLRDFRL